MLRLHVLWSVFAHLYTCIHTFHASVFSCMSMFIITPRVLTSIATTCKPVIVIVIIVIVIVVVVVVVVIIIIIIIIGISMFTFISMFICTYDTYTGYTYFHVPAETQLYVCMQIFDEHF